MHWVLCQPGLPGDFRDRWELQGREEGVGENWKIRNQCHNEVYSLPIQALILRLREDPILPLWAEFEASFIKQILARQMDSGHLGFLEFPAECLRDTCWGLFYLFIYLFYMWACADANHSTHTETGGQLSGISSLCSLCWSLGIKLRLLAGLVASAFTSQATLLDLITNLSSRPTYWIILSLHWRRYSDLPMSLLVMSESTSDTTVSSSCTLMVFVLDPHHCKLKECPELQPPPGACPVCAQSSLNTLQIWSLQDQPQSMRGETGRNTSAFQSFGRTSFWLVF